MKFMNNLKIGFRMNLISALLVSIIVSTISGYNYLHQKAQVLNEVDDNLKSELNDFSNYINLELSKNERYTKLGIELFKERFKNEGRISVRNDEKVNYRAVNQVSKEVVNISIPSWYLGGKKLQSDVTLVDEIQKEGITSATIFQRIPEGFLRISTNVLNVEGKRATGTFIPNSSPVVKSILNGEDYNGRAFVVSDWYITAYSPIYINGEVQGMIYVGHPEKDLTDLKSIFYQKKYYDNGYPYLVSTDGKLIIHPTSEGKDVSDQEFFKKTLATTNEVEKITYVFDGKSKITFVKKMANIEAYLSFTVFEDDLIKDLRDLLFINALVAILSIFLFVLVNMYFGKTITNGLSKGVKFAQELAKGNLTSTIEMNQKDEVGELAKAMNIMVAKLREIIEGIVSNSGSISSASSQLGSTSEVLSQSASEQASTVEELSSTMEEIAALVETSSDNAQKTEIIAMQAQSSIEAVIREAMETIEQNKQIASKIEIISDIAFQTNILALNAAVEAARAGEMGRGFAVVAGEVRNLADSSKKAADEITNISNLSLKRNEESRKNLSDLLPEIKKTTELVKEIANSSEQHSLGIIQINNSIQEMNNVAQQNAASSEEMAASSEELSAQAQELTNLIAFFRVR